jgi:hypothetical protein
LRPKYAKCALTHSTSAGRSEQAEILAKITRFSACRVRQLLYVDSPPVSGLAGGWAFLSSSFELSYLLSVIR